MEKENDRMLQDEEQLAEKRLKLDYHDLKTSDQVIFDTWEWIAFNKTQEAVELMFKLKKIGPQIRPNKT